MFSESELIQIRAGIEARQAESDKRAMPIAVNGYYWIAGRAHFCVRYNDIVLASVNGGKSWAWEDGTPVTGEPAKILRTRAQKLRKAKMNDTIGRLSTSRRDSSFVAGWTTAAPRKYAYAAMK